MQKDKFQQQREQVYKEKELTSSTHFMRKESRVQRRKQDLFRAKLKQGVHVYVFDATHNVRKKALLKMDIGSDEMYLCNRLARYSAVPTRMTDIKPVNFTDILECVPGALIDKNILRSMIAADVESILSNQCFLTIVSHNTSSGSRNLILLLETREERNSLLQNVRALTEEVQSKSSANSAPPAPKVPSLGLGPPNVTANFLSPTTASRRKSLSMSSFPPEALQEVEVLDTPRTAKNRHDLFDRASARKVARTIQVRPEEQAAAAPFIRSEENSAVWNPELRSYEQPTRSFLKSAEVASMKLNEISDRNNVSVWRPSGVSSPYLSHRALSARPPLLSQFDDAIGLGRPAMIDTNSPDHSSQIPSSSRSRKYSSSSAGSESESRSPLAKHILQDKIRCSDPTPKNGNSDSEESRNSPASKKDALPMTDALTMTSPVVQGIASTPTPKRRPNLTLQVAAVIIVR